MPRKKNLQLAGALGQASVDKRVEILRRVAEVGSISQAARDAGVSYKAAWQALDTLSNLAGAALVERAVGGAGGGGARLTPAGEQVLRAAGEVARARDSVLEKLRAGAPALGALGLRTSMRNQLPCEVEQVDVQGPLAKVVLRLAGGGVLVSRITSESAQLLGLLPGLAVVALCKATATHVERAVAIGAGPGRLADGAANGLSGKATRVLRGDAGDEVGVRLPGGQVVVGFAAPRSGLRAGSAVGVRVDESAVVIALP